MVEACPAATRSVQLERSVPEFAAFRITMSIKKDLPFAPIGASSSDSDSSELRRHYLQNLVHELSTPLTPLLGYVRLFQNQSLGELNDLQSRCLERMRHAAERLRRTLDEVTYLLQLESGMFEIEPTPVNFHELLQRAFDRLKEHADEVEIEVLFELDPNVGEVTGDETTLRLAVEHLISNGLKFNSPGGKLLIRTSRTSPQTTQLELYDSGIGIGEMEIERVFEPFYQCDLKATRRFEGSGLGLPLAKWIIELHGGVLTLESPPEKQPEGHYFRGVCARVELPV